ncbi:DUF742 domain-containing protein [Streptomyces sp. KR80]|uniref:DUF742 domain-containing protein n=1 Tax=Streptomyces sp. KR80 TaxID=3457426 RepID=UPI003FD09B02
MTGHPAESYPHEGGEAWNTSPPQPSAAAGLPLDLTPRPFLITQGRTRGSSDAIAIETQVVATDWGLAESPHAAFERRDIISLCREPLSVAEISARLGLHLNVVRVLVADLYADGHVIAHLPEFDASKDVDTLRRVIRGLREIS